MVGRPASASTLERRALAALRKSSSFSELRDLYIEQHGSRLAISGRVSSFYHKQLAQELVGAIIDDEQVELVNLATVDYPV
jgi:hypothetical protein